MRPECSPAPPAPGFGDALFLLSTGKTAGNAASRRLVDRESHVRKTSGGVGVSILVLRGLGVGTDL